TLTASGLDSAPQQPKICNHFTPCMFGPLGVMLSYDSTPGYKSGVATQKVQGDWAVRANLGSLSQWRLQFLTNDDGDAQQDSVSLVSGDNATDRPYLSVTYEVP